MALTVVATYANMGIVCILTHASTGHAPVMHCHGTNSHFTIERLHVMSSKFEITHRACHFFQIYQYVVAEPPRTLIYWYFYTEIETKILNTDYDQKILIVETQLLVTLQ